MERHICVWHKENYDERDEVGELIIDGSLIEFYSRFYGEVFPSTYIGWDGEHRYKIFVNGSARYSERKTLDNVESHRVLYVLMQNFQFSKGMKIDSIQGFSFEIPELVKWLGIKTVSFASTDQGSLGAMELHMDPIIPKKENPHIEIGLESRSFDTSIRGDDSVALTIKNIPRIYIHYNEKKTVDTVINDIECLMQFFGLLIGTVSTVDDIRLSIEGQDLKSWLYLNQDFSYNIRTKIVIEKPRTYYYVLAEKIDTYYESWRNFYFDATYELLRRIYFAANGRKEMFAEEIFVEYMRFLDGYHTRICGDEETKSKIKESLKNATNRIKTLLFNEEGKALFEEAMIAADPDWKCNSAHIKEIAGWIAAGYLGKTQLSYRLQELDNKFLSIISKNAIGIEKNTRNFAKHENKTDEELKQIYFKELGDTRNFYSHYKLDKSGVLELQQICSSIDVLKATIISILFSHMGMEMDLIRKIMEFDSELHWQTMCLREEGERPFNPPNNLENIQGKKQKLPIRRRSRRKRTRCYRNAKRRNNRQIIDKSKIVKNRIDSSLPRRQGIGLHRYIIVR